MNYQKIITDLEHHASEAAEFLASYPDHDEMESEKAAHRAMVCAVHALKTLMQERAALEIENHKLRSELEYIVDFDCGHWAAGKHENEAIRMGYQALKQIAADAIANTQGRRHWIRPMTSSQNDRDEPRAGSAATPKEKNTL